MIEETVGVRITRKGMLLVGLMHEFNISFGEAALAANRISTLGPEDAREKAVLDKVNARFEQAGVK